MAVELDRAVRIAHTEGINSAAKWMHWYRNSMLNFFGKIPLVGLFWDRLVIDNIFNMINSEALVQEAGQEYYESVLRGKPYLPYMGPGEWTSQSGQIEQGRSLQRSRAELVQEKRRKKKKIKK